MAAPEMIGGLPVEYVRARRAWGGEPAEWACACRDDRIDDPAAQWSVITVRPGQGQPEHMPPLADGTWDVLSVHHPLSETTSRYLVDHLANRLSEHGWPVHERLAGVQRDRLTRCGLFSNGIEKRVTEELAAVDCADCRSAAPASACVTLPSGLVIERRSAALAEYRWATALHNDRFGWELSSWQNDPSEARSWVTDRYTGRPRPNMTILTVEETGQ